MNVTPHDFTKPTPLSVGWQTRIANWHQAALALANKSWAKDLTASLEASIVDHDLCYAHQAMSQVGDDALVYRVKLGERLISILILPRRLVLHVVGTLIGDKSAAAADRELTLIEERLGEYFLIHHWLSFFRDSWPGAKGVTWMLEGRESNLACSRLYPDTEVLTSMNWQMRGAWGELAGVWHFPKKGLLDLWDNRSATAQDAIPDAQLAVHREAIARQIPVSVEVVLGSAELPLSELSSLQVGDVVLLDQRTTDGVIARIGGLEVFRGQAGRIGTRKAFQIENNVKK